MHLKLIKNQSCIFRSVSGGTDGKSRTSMQTGTRKPPIPPRIKFRGHFGCFGEFRSISASMGISAGLLFEDFFFLSISHLQHSSRALSLSLSTNLKPISLIWLFKSETHCHQTKRRGIGFEGGAIPSGSFSSSSFFFFFFFFFFLLLLSSFFFFSVFSAQLSLCHFFFFSFLSFAEW
jgi:hypothetical protein